MPLGDAGARGRGPVATRPNSPTSPSSCAAAKSSASTASSAPAAPSSCRRCSASPSTSRRHASRSRASRSPSRAPADAVDAGIVYVPEERQRQGVVLGAADLPERHAALARARTSRNGFLDLARRVRARPQATPSGSTCAPRALSQDVGTLSGGNQQKVVIGKWLATSPRVIILDEPTKGIDVGSKAAVHAFMGELVAQGLAVIMVSSELPEILGMSDRVIVMREGRIAGALRPRRASPPRRWSPPPPATRGGGRLMRLNRDLLLAAIVVVMIVAVGLLTPAFVSPDNLVGLFNDTAILIMLALGADGGDPHQLASTCRSPPTSRFTGMVVALINAAYPGMPIPLLMLIARAASGCVLGAFNGAMVWLARHPLDRRDARHAVDLSRPRVPRLGRHLDQRRPDEPRLHRRAARRVPRPAGDVVVRDHRRHRASAVAADASRRIGRAFFAAGGNPTAAVYAGIDVGRTQFIAFCISGTVAGFCGYLWVVALHHRLCRYRRRLRALGHRRLRHRRRLDLRRHRHGRRRGARRAVPRRHQERAAGDPRLALLAAGDLGRRHPRRRGPQRRARAPARAASSCARRRPR